MYRGDLALNINRVLFQELLLSASLGFPFPASTAADTPLLRPDGLQKARKCACN